MTAESLRHADESCPGLDRFTTRGSAEARQSPQPAAPGRARTGRPYRWPRPVGGARMALSPGTIRSWPHPPRRWTPTPASRSMSTCSQSGGGASAQGQHGPDPGGPRRRLRHPVRHRRAAGRAHGRTDRPAAARAPARPEHRLRGAELGGPARVVRPDRRPRPRPALPAPRHPRLAAQPSPPRAGASVLRLPAAGARRRSGRLRLSPGDLLQPRRAGRLPRLLVLGLALPAGRGALGRPADDRRDDVPARHLSRVHRPRLGAAAQPGAPGDADGARAGRQPRAEEASRSRRRPAISRRPAAAPSRRTSPRRNSSRPSATRSARR